VTTASGAGGAQAAREADAGATGAVPLLRIPGQVSAATVRSRLTADSRVKAALDDAARRGAEATGSRLGSGGGAAGPGGGSGGETAGPRDQNPSASSQRQATPAAPSGDLSNATGRSTATAPAALAACLTAATAAAEPATLPLTPAFYVEGTYRGRPATILVTTGGQPGRVDLWAFPLDDCSSPLLGGERVR
jgi:hypothetical protein